MQTLRWTLLVVSLMVAATAARAALGPGDHLDLTLDHGGLTRTYDLHIPPSHDGATPVPLVIDFHAFLATKAIQKALSGFAAASDLHGFVVAWPQGIGNSWNAGTFCCGQAQQQDIDDVGFARALIDAIASAVTIDRRRVYATGLSNGGAMSDFLACTAADVFAAVAPFSFPESMTPFSGCQPSRPISVIHIHGLNDLAAPYNGRPPLLAPLPQTLEDWRLENGCVGTPVTTYQQNQSACETYTACAAGVETGLCSVLGNHLVYLNGDGFPGAGYAWDRLRRFALPTPIGGRKLVVTDRGDASRRKIAFTSSDPQLDTSLETGVRPTTDGATMQLFNPVSSESSCFVLPSSGWKATGRPPDFTYAYADKNAVNGPCKQARIRGGKQLKVTCTAKRAPIPFSLDEPSQGRLAIRFASGAFSYCAEFGGVVRTDSGTDPPVPGGRGRWTAVDAPAPPACPRPPACP